MELLNNMVSAGANASEASFKILGWMSSGPGDLEVSRFFNFFKTMSSVTSMEDRGDVFKTLFAMVGISPSASCTITEANWFARTSACSSTLSVNLPVFGFSRGDIADFTFVLDFIYFHSFLGFSLDSFAMLASYFISASLMSLFTLFLCALHFLSLLFAFVS